MSIPDLVPDGPLDPQWWTKAAQAAVRRYCGWHVAPSISETVTVDAYGGKALLVPSKHITELKSVKIGETDVTDRVYFSKAGTLLIRGGWWPDLPGSVTVEMQHGYELEEVPDVAALILAIGKRAKSDPGVIASQSVNGATVAYQTAGGAPLGVALLDIEKAALETHRLNWGV